MDNEELKEDILEAMEELGINPNQQIGTLLDLLSDDEDAE